MDWPHAFATGVPIAAVCWLVERTGMVEGKSRGTATSRGGLQ